MNPKSPGTPHHLAVAGVLAVFVLLGYGNSFRCGWVGDIAHLKLDHRLRATTWEDGQHAGIKRIFTEDYWWPKMSSGLYRPLTTLSYWLNWRWSCWGKQNGLQPTSIDSQTSPGCEASIVGFQAVNLALHWGNAVLVYFVALRITGRFFVAALAAALFATHPIATEAVTNLVGRADLLAAMAVLAGLLTYIRSTAATSWRKSAWLVGLMLITTVGVFSKENAVVVVGAVACYDLAFRWFERPDWHERVRQVFASGVRYLALAPPFLAFFLTRHLVFSRSEIPPEKHFLDNPLYGLDFLAGRMTALRVAALQLGHLVWPANLSSDYSYNQIPLFQGDLAGREDWQPVLVLAAIAAAALAIVRFRRNRELLFCAGFYVVSYLPTSNLLLNIGSIMADRFMYLPLCGVCSAGGAWDRGLVEQAWRTAGASRVARRHALLALAPSVVLSALVLAGVWRTWQRNLDWESNATIASAAIQTSPRSFRPYHSLAKVLSAEDRSGNVDRALELAGQAVQIIDDLPDGLNWCDPYIDLGIYQAGKARLLSQPAADGSLHVPEGARVWFRASAATLERAISIDRAFNEANRRRDLGRGKTPDKVPDTGRPELYTHLGEAYLRLDLPEKAGESLRYARHISPSDWDSCFKLALLQLTMKHWERGCIGLIECLIMEPSNSQPWPLIESVYQRIETGRIPALASEQGVPRLNLENPVVYDHFCRAYQDLVRTCRQGRRQQTAETIRSVAVERLGLPADLFAPVPTSDADLPRPPESVFYKRGERLPISPRELPSADESP